MLGLKESTLKSV